MSTIDLENAKQIREPMEVYCGISAEDTKATNTISGIPSANSVGILDANASTSLKQSGWSQVGLADLSGGGFALDTGLVFPVQPHAATEAEKYGIQSKVGEGFSITVKTSNASVSLVTSGSGSVTVDGKSYTLQNNMVVPVTKNTNTVLTFVNSDQDARVVVYTAVPGVSLMFTNANLVSVVLDLAGNLSLEAPSFEASGIEIAAYYPDDIADIISTVEDDTPLWYYAGYDGDYSETRNFYLCEQATMENNVITLRGEDASAKLADATVPATVFQSPRANASGLYNLYSLSSKVITNAGIKLVHKQGLTKPSTPYEARRVCIPEQSAQDFFAGIMVDGHMRYSETSCWISFTDAGIPRLYNRLIVSGDTYRQPWQLKVWDIYEEDCADVVRNVDRRINGVKASSEDGYVYAGSVTFTGNGFFDSMDVQAGAVSSYEYDGFIEGLNTSNKSKTIYQSANRLIFVAKTTGKAHFPISPIAIGGVLSSDVVSPSYPGIKALVDPFAIGQIYFKSGSYTSIPNYGMRYNGSNITGSFTFKGDPRMQPRDIFKFHRLDGTVEVATIERIELTHEEGGTTAELHYRLGVC